MGNKLLTQAKPYLPKTGEPTVSHIFKITSDKLKVMFMRQTEENLVDPIDALKE